MNGLTRHPVVRYLAARVLFFVLTLGALLWVFRTFNVVILAWAVAWSLVMTHWLCREELDRLRFYILTKMGRVRPLEATIDEDESL